MKYFKFTQISADTGISWVIDQPVSGPTLPFDILPGLSIVAEIDKPYYLGTANDEAQSNPKNYIFELSFEEFATELKNVTLSEITKRKIDIYKEEYDLRTSIFNKYHESASLAGIYKYEQAKLLVADSNAVAPDVRAEATAREMDLLVLANRIIQNHEDFRSKEAKIAGIRGKILDRLNSFVFDMNNPILSHSNFYKQVETIGIEIIPVMNFETNQIERKEMEVKIGFYSTNLDRRFFTI